MDFDLTPEQQEIRKLARDFADREIAPGARERDRIETPPSASRRRRPFSVLPRAAGVFLSRSCKACRAMPFPRAFLSTLTEKLAAFH